MAVIGTKYSVRDASGVVLCHSAGQSKSNADSKRKRAVREGFALMCEAAGMRDGDLYRDSITGAWLPMEGSACECGANDWHPAARQCKACGAYRGETVERGHVISDAADGAFCPCNLIPENRSHNKNHGNKSLDPRRFATGDARVAWREVWLTHYATPNKARRAV